MLQTCTTIILLAGAGQASTDVNSQHAPIAIAVHTRHRAGRCRLGFSVDNFTTPICRSTEWKQLNLDAAQLHAAPEGACDEAQHAYQAQLKNSYKADKSPRCGIAGFQGVALLGCHSWGRRPLHPDLGQEHARSNSKTTSGTADTCHDCSRMQH
jgi:hypothetical protein